MSDPTHSRVLGHTARMCEIDLKFNPGRSMCIIGSELNKILNPIGIHLKYLNQPNLDKESQDYNPDGTIGKFEVTQYHPPSDA